MIPFYRGVSILQRTLAALARQTYPHALMEVILAQDGSVERVEDLACETLGDIACRSVWVPRRGYRLSTVRNYGVRAALGPTIVLLDFDMLVQSNFVAEHVRWHTTSSLVVTFGLRKFVDARTISASAIAAGRVDFASLPDVPSISNRRNSIDRRISELTNMPEHPHPYNLCHGCNLAFDRTVAIRAGLFDEAFNGYSNYEDIEFAYRMVQQGCRVAHVPTVLAYHQENEIVGEAERLRGMAVNLQRLYERVPGLREYREMLSAARERALDGRTA